MIDYLLWALIALALLTAFCAACAWFDNLKYDEWVREFESNGGIQWPCEVLDGSTVVSHTVLTERRKNPR